MKKILFIVVLALPVAWWLKDPETAKQNLVSSLRWTELKIGDLIERLEGETSSEDGISREEKLAAAAEVEALPEGVYLLRENLIARYLPVPGTIYRGSKVKIIGKAEGKHLIFDGVREALADDSQLTRDPKEAPALLQAAKTAREAQLQKRRQELEAKLAQIDSKIASLQQELEGVRARDAKVREEGKRSTQYVTQEGFLVTEIRRQNGYRDAVLNEIQALRQSEP